MKDLLLNRAQDVLRRGTRPHYVYFILAPGPRWAVKIGTATDLGQRLSALRSPGTKAPSWIRADTMHLHGWVEGDQELESLLHRAFSQHRLIGEWFDYEDTRDHIEALLADWCLCHGCQMERTNLAHI